MLELSFTLLEAPELWHKTGAQATPAEFLQDLYPGHLTLRVAGVDLSPPGYPPFFGFATGMTGALALLQPNGSASVLLWSELDDRIRLRDEGDGQIRLSVDWSGTSHVVDGRELRRGWAFFVKRIVAELVGRDRSAADPVAARETMAAAESMCANLDGPALVELRGSFAGAHAEEARRQTEEFCWSYGGFLGAGLSPVVVDVIAGDFLLVDGWDGDRLGGAPRYQAVVPIDADIATFAFVMTSAVLDVLSAGGRINSLLVEALLVRKQALAAVEQK